MITARRVLYGIATVLLVCGVWYLRHKRDVKIDTEIKSTILKPEDSAKLIVDPRRHTIITITRDKAGNTETRGTFLPDSGASVELSKSGKVTVNTRPWGTEVRPFLGGAFGVDIKLRAAAGLNLFYWYRWEFGGGLLAGGTVKDTRLFMHVSYNLYDSYFLSIGADNRGTAHLIAGLKF